MFFDTEADQEDLYPKPVVEESIYTDDPVEVYLREMGAVPLFTREGELDLARRMERGMLRMRKAISRSGLSSKTDSKPIAAASATITSGFLQTPSSKVPRGASCRRKDNAQAAVLPMRC